MSNWVADHWLCDVCLEENIYERTVCYSCMSFKPGHRTTPAPLPGPFNQPPPPPGARTPPDPPLGARTPPDPPSGACTPPERPPGAYTPPGRPPGACTPPGRPPGACTPPGPPPGPPPHTPYQELENGVATKKKTTWKCRICKMVNSAKNKQCYLCDALKPAKAREKTLDISAHDWVCKYCKGTNFAKREMCYTCNAFKESSITTAPDIEYWACDVCAYKTSHGPYCFQCGTGRNKTVPPSTDNWKCSKCGKINFAKRGQCYSCHGRIKKRSPEPQPWSCPTCKFCNDYKTSVCKLCQYTRPAPPSQHSDSRKRRLLKQTSSSSSSPVNYYLIPEDWDCQSCDSKNNALRNFCNECDTPRKSIAKLYAKYKKVGISALLKDSLHNQNTDSHHAADSFSQSREVSQPREPEVNHPREANHHDQQTNFEPQPPEEQKMASRTCAKCRAPCMGQYCYDCAHNMGIRQERESWECMHCHLVDENTVICMGCGRNKSESSIGAIRYLTCPSCRTKNHAHKTHCVRCLKSLTSHEVAAPGPDKAKIPATSETWRCQYCDIAVLMKSTHCRGCNRRRQKAEKVPYKKRGDVNQAKAVQKPTPKDVRPHYVASATTEEGSSEVRSGSIEIEEGEYKEEEYKQEEEHKQDEKCKHEEEYKQEEEYKDKIPKESYNEDHDYFQDQEYTDDQEFYNDEDQQFYEDDHYEDDHYFDHQPPPYRGPRPHRPPRGPPPGPPRHPPPGQRPPLFPAYTGRGPRSYPPLHHPMENNAMHRTVPPRGPPRLHRPFRMRGPGQPSPRDHPPRHTMPVRRKPMNMMVLN